MFSVRPPKPPQPPAFILPALAPVLIAGLAASVEAATRRKERSRPPPGRLVALRNHGRRIHVIYHNPPRLRAAPCVVMEAGANSWSPMWHDVALRLGHVARVLRYDRAGFGFSDPVHTSRARTVRSTADELLALLRATGARPPYVLVAHSLGALYINVLLRQLDPAHVCGVVYVDAASPQTVRLLEKVVPSASPPVWLARCLGALGLLRVLSPVLLRPYAAAFRGDLMREALATWARGDWLLSYTREWEAALRSIRLPHAPDDLCFPSGWLGSLPIAVLVPDVYERTQGKAYITRLQRSIAQYSTDATVIPVPDCGHFVQLERPDIVADAVQLVISRSRERRLRDARHAEPAPCDPPASNLDAEIDPL